MGSNFKVKLVGYFVFLALVPLAAAFWGFSSIAARSETRQVDARLESGLRAGLAGYADALDAAGTRAERLAKRRGFAAALARRDRAELRRFLASSPNLRVQAEPLALGGAVAGPAATRKVPVIGPRRTI